MYNQNKINPLRIVLVVNSFFFVNRIKLRLQLMNLKHENFEGMLCAVWKYFIKTI